MRSASGTELFNVMRSAFQPLPLATQAFQVNHLHCANRSFPAALGAKAAYACRYIGLLRGFNARVTYHLSDLLVSITNQD
jgi:hypothetical protein